MQANHTNESDDSCTTVKQVKLSRALARAVQHGVTNVNAVAAEADAARVAAENAQRKLQAVVGVNQQFIAALVIDAGFKPEDFARFGVWEDAGEVYLRAGE